jgi:hypothetical protein
VPLGHGRAAVELVQKPLLGEGKVGQRQSPGRRRNVFRQSNFLNQLVLKWKLYESVSVAIYRQSLNRVNFFNYCGF